VSLRYVSPLHSDDDPGGLIGQALAMGPEFPGPAEDLLLAWSLRLPEGGEAAAAGSLLRRHGLEQGALPDDPRGRLVALLRQAAADGGYARRGRRGGWRGRRGLAEG